MDRAWTELAARLAFELVALLTQAHPELDGAPGESLACSSRVLRTPGWRICTAAPHGQLDRSTGSSRDEIRKHARKESPISIDPPIELSVAMSADILCACLTNESHLKIKN